ncbi:MAG: class I SAM-dependent methyltransferase [Patescibacteria group bacterium]|jgi:ubiquinone/menaquinone biosynthesis C-methylase UbiE
MPKKINDDNWKIWDEFNVYGDILYKRAIGKIEEMQSAKSICKLLPSFYKKGMSLLDVGCGAGHYLRSLQLRLDKNIKYTGVDATKNYIKLAKKAFGSKANFLTGDIFNLPFNDKAFDIVMCNNVILHLPPPPTKAISELIRVAKKYIVIRTVIGERNYIIKEVRNFNEGAKLKVKDEDLIGKNGYPLSYNFFNMYTTEYLKGIINRIDKNLEVKIVSDNEWKSFNNRKIAGALATKVIDGRQVSGNLMLDWRYIIVKKKI